MQVSLGIHLAGMERFPAIWQQGLLKSQVNLGFRASWFHRRSSKGHGPRGELGRYLPRSVGATYPWRGEVGLGQPERPPRSSAGPAPNAQASQGNNPRGASLPCCWRARAALGAPLASPAEVRGPSFHHFPLRSVSSNLHPTKQPTVYSNFPPRTVA